MGKLIVSHIIVLLNRIAIVDDYMRVWNLLLLHYLDYFKKYIWNKIQLHWQNLSNDTEINFHQELILKSIKSNLHKKHSTFENWECNIDDIGKQKSIMTWIYLQNQMQWNWYTYTSQRKRQRKEEK